MGRGPAGPVGPFHHPLTGTKIGVQLCTSNLLWGNPLAGPDIDFGNAASTTYPAASKDFSTDCNNNTTNAASASPDYLAEFSIPEPGSNFSSLITYGPPNSVIAPGPGAPGYSAATNPPLGAVAGTVISNLTRLSLKIGGTISPCNQNVPVEFEMLNSTVDSTVYGAFGAGAVTAATGTTATLSAGAFAQAALGRGIRITGGTGVGQGRYITVVGGGNTITVDRLWEIQPDGTSTIEISNMIYPKTPGIANHLNPLAVADPANAALPLQTTRYPSYLNDIFDPDSLHPFLNKFSTGTTFPAVNGVLPPLQPLARYSGRQLVAGDDIILQFLIFPKNSLKQFQALVNHSWGQLVDFWGYPSVVILNDPTVPASPSLIQDFCSPLGSTTLFMGSMRENKTGTTVCTNGSDALACLNTPPFDTTLAQCPGPVNCGARYMNPAASQGFQGGNTNLFITTWTSYRDADNDGIENELDACATTAQTQGTDWSDTVGGLSNGNSGGPRIADNAVDGRWDDDADKLPNACDPAATTSNIDQDAVTEINGSPATGYTATTVSDTTQTWTTNQYRGHVVVTATGGTRAIVSNTACPGTCTLTVDRQWDTTPTAPEAYSVLNENFANAQDNCPLVANQDQFSSELLSNFPEDGGPHDDGIGDVCDPNPTKVDGHYHVEVAFDPYCVTASMATDDTDADGWCNADETAFGSNTALNTSIPQTIYMDIIYGLARNEGIMSSGTPAAGSVTLGSVPWVQAATTPSNVGMGITAVVSGGITYYPHPDTGKPVSGVPRPCSDGYDQVGSGNVDRADPNCRVASLGLPCGQTGQAACANAKITNATWGLDHIFPTLDTDGDGMPDWREILRGTDPYSKCPDTTSNNELLDPWTYDINDDSTVNILDVSAMFPYWLKPETDVLFNYRADMTLDGTVNILDVSALFPFWLKNLHIPGPTPPWVCP